MTGEIDLNGEVHQIGGLEAKINGAKRAGVTKVLIPSENKDDYDKIVEKADEGFFDNLEIVQVSTIQEVLDNTLVK